MLIESYQISKALEHQRSIGAVAFTKSKLGIFLIDGGPRLLHEKVGWTNLFEKPVKDITVHHTGFKSGLVALEDNHDIPALFTTEILGAKLSRFKSAIVRIILHRGILTRYVKNTRKIQDWKKSRSDAESSCNIRRKWYSVIRRSQRHSTIDHGETKMETATASQSKPSKGGIKGLMLGRNDIFRLSPASIDIDPTFNARDFTTPDNIAHVAWLADSIESEGVQEPMRGYVKGDRFVVTNGESRMRAIALLAKRGVVIESVPAQLEGRYSNDADRLYTQVTSNSGKAFSPMETSMLYRRMLNLGQTEQQIATRTGMDVRRVKQLLDLQSLPSEVQKMVSEGTVKTTLAMEIFIGNERDPAKTITAIKGAVENATVAGKKVTKKFVGGENGEKKASPAKQLKLDCATMKEIFGAADFAEDEDEDGTAITVITVTRDQADQIKAILALG